MTWQLTDFRNERFPAVQRRIEFTTAILEGTKVVHSNGITALWKGFTVSSLDDSLCNTHGKSCCWGKETTTRTGEYHDLIYYLVKLRLSFINCTAIPSHLMTWSTPLWMRSCDVPNVASTPCRAVLIPTEQTEQSRGRVELAFQDTILVYREPYLTHWLTEFNPHFSILYQGRNSEILIIILGILFILRWSSWFNRRRIKRHSVGCFDFAELNKFPIELSMQLQPSITYKIKPAASASASIAAGWLSFQNL